MAFRQLHVAVGERLRAEVFFTQLPSGAQREVLRYRQVRMARVEPQRPHLVVLQLQVVQTPVELVPQLSVSENVLVRYELLGVNVPQIPTEVVAAELLAQLFPVGQVADSGAELEVRLVHEEQTLVVVHPDVGHACRVDAVRVLVVREGVRVEVAEYVAHPRTGHLRRGGNLSIIQWNDK